MAQSEVGTSTVVLHNTSVEVSGFLLQVLPTMRDAPEDFEKLVVEGQEFRKFTIDLDLETLGY